MRTPILGRGLLTFLRVITLISLETFSQREPPKGSSRRQRESRPLNPENVKDVRDFQKKLHKADLNIARQLLRLIKTIRELKHDSDDPRKIEERRVELETITKGRYRDGIGWVWNGHVVPEPPSTTAFFERRMRIVSNGVWNPSRKGWEYQGEFFGVWEY